MEKAYIDAFIGSIKRGPFSNLDTSEDTSEKVSGKVPGIEKPNIYDFAVYQAYLDMCRTVSGVKDKLQPARKEIADSLRGYFEQEQIFCKFCFDAWHKNLMKSVHDIEEKLTFGQIQKIINMAFKYLYCCKDFRQKHSGKKFDHCHMALDSYTLAWFKRLHKETYREIPKDKNGDGSWSKIGAYDLYLKIVGDTRGSCNEAIWPNESNPFLAEFLIWPHEQAINAAHEAKKNMDIIGALSEINSESEIGELLKRLSPDTQSKELEKLENAMIALVLPKESA